MESTTVGTGTFRQVNFVNPMGDSVGQGVESLHLVLHADPRLTRTDRFGALRHGVSFDVPSHGDGIFASEEYTYATWSNGAVAFQVHGEHYNYDDIKLDPVFTSPSDTTSGI